MFFFSIMIKKQDFVEIEFTGKANGELFDTNIKKEAEKSNLDIKIEPLTIVVGQKMLVEGFDKALEGKETGKKYKVKLKKGEDFGDRKRELIRTIPISVFIEKNVNPQRGMTFLLDNTLVKIIAVSGGRVITDFNNPLSGKEIEYGFTIKKKIDKLEEKIDALNNFFFKQKLDFEIKDKIIFKVDEKIMPFVESLKDKFKEILKKEIKVEEKKVEEKIEESKIKQASKNENKKSNSK